jgi:hypothetical protein
MGATACGSLDCLGAALGLGPPRGSLGIIFSGLGTASVPTGTLLSASGPWCGPHPIDSVSPRGIAGWHLRHSPLLWATRTPSLWGGQPSHHRPGRTGESCGPTRGGPEAPNDRR